MEYKNKLQVVCLTYNHKNYIEDALKGFIMQKTSFNFEVLVGDDCSTDGTSEIIEKYVQKYPKIIKHIRHDKNLGPQLNSYNILNMITAEYLALCEGDDYWTDPYKLQKQVDFLEKNRHLNGCFHNAEIKKELGVKFWNSDFNFPPDQFGRQFWPNSIINFNPDKKIYYMDDVVTGIIATASIVYRYDKTIIYPDWFKNCVAGDRPLHCFLCKSNGFGYINETMSVYRVSPNGIWFNKNSEKINVQDIFEWVNLIDNINNYFEYAYKKIFDRYKEGTIINAFKTTIKQQDTETLISLISKYPNIFFEKIININFDNNKLIDFKKIKYKFFGIPILKIKTNIYNTKYYLFGFIPVLNIKRY